MPEGLWQEISIDIIGLLLQSNRKDVIVVIVDQFMKIIQLKVVTMAILSQEIVNIYQGKIWKLYEVSRKILSNRGP